MSAKALHRSKDKVIAGVCGGFAEYFGWDKTLVRVVYAVATVLTLGFPGIVAYIVAWILMPAAK